MAYLLDTNILSELRLTQRANPSVFAWRQTLAPEELYISVLVLGEIRRGIESKRSKDPVAAKAFERWLNEIEVSSEDRILPVTREICDIWGRLAATYPMAVVDGLIAATAACHDLTVATRNTRDFQKCGVDFINPFEYQE